MYKRGGGLGHSIKKRLLYRLFRQKWNIAVTHHPVTEVAGLEGDRKQKAALDDLVWMKECRGAFFADPFIVSSDESSDEFKVLYEHLEWKSGRGRIDCVSYDARKGTFGERKISFESSSHLSYPFIIQHNGSYGFLPEHSEARELALYNIGPDGMAQDKRVLVPQMPLVDSTIMFWQGLYWKFATFAGERDNSHLHIFFASDLFGPWVGHEGNPVKVDKANARPAGQPIFHRGGLFRPAQDCASHYGSAIIVNEIKVLTKEDFVEEPVAEIRPELGSTYDFGLHTISSSGGITVIDGARLESKLHPVLDRFARFVR